MTTYAERNRKAEKSIRSMDNRLSLGIGRSTQEQDQELPPAKGWKKYDTTYWEQEGCNLHLDLDDAHALAAKGLPDDGSNRSESFLDARRGAYWSRKLSAPKDPPEALEDLGPVALPPKDKGEDKHNVSLLRVATSSPPVSWPALPCGNIGNCPCISLIIFNKYFFYCWVKKPSYRRGTCRDY